MVGVLHKHGDAAFAVSERSGSQSAAQRNPPAIRRHRRADRLSWANSIGWRLSAPPDPGTPAARAKLQPGDFILAINDQPTDGIKMSDVLRLVRGEPGTLLRLTIESPSEPQPRTVELVREVINTESVLGDRRDKDGSWQFRLESDPRIALIRITSFGDRTAAEFANVMTKL